MLSKRLGIGRTPIREALQRLAREGLVQILPRRGVIVSAINVKTLSEAARSLGAGWGTVMWRVIAPNMSAALLNACLLSVALVLGEFTFANLLGYVNLQVEINQLGQANAGVSIAVSVASLLFAFVLLMVLSFVGAARQALRAKPRPSDPRLEAMWGQKA